MRRALALIVVLGLLSFGSGWYLDRVRMQTAQQYMQALTQVRSSILDNRWQDALTLSRELYALWQRDERWLKCLISHHHTREVQAALIRLDTGLVQHWADEALPAVDDAYLSLMEISTGHLPVLENLI